MNTFTHYFSSIVNFPKFNLRRVFNDMKMYGNLVYILKL